MLTFCNSYVLWLLRCVQLRLVTVTFCDVNVCDATFCRSTLLHLQGLYVLHPGIRHYCWDLAGTYPARWQFGDDVVGRRQRPDQQVSELAVTKGGEDATEEFLSKLNASHKADYKAGGVTRWAIVATGPRALQLCLPASSSRIKANSIFRMDNCPGVLLGSQPLAVRFNPNPS